MGVPVALGKLVLLGLTALGAWGTWGLASTNGTFALLTKVRQLNRLDVNGPQNSTVHLRQRWTGIAPFDDFFVAMVCFFWPTLDGSSPATTLQSLHFLGQAMSLWMLLYVEALRVGNKYRIVSLCVQILCQLCESKLMFLQYHDLWLAHGECGYSNSCPSVLFRAFDDFTHGFVPHANPKGTPKKEPTGPPFCVSNTSLVHHARRRDSNAAHGPFLPCGQILLARQRFMDRLTDPSPTLDLHQSFISIHCGPARIGGSSRPGSRTASVPCPAADAQHHPIRRCNTTHCSDFHFTGNDHRTSVHDSRDEGHSINEKHLSTEFRPNAWHSEHNCGGRGCIPVLG